MSQLPERKRTKPPHRGPVPAAGGECQGLRDLHAGRDGPREHVECRRRAHQGVRGAGDHRQALLYLLSCRRRSARPSGLRAAGRNSGRTFRGRGLADAQGRLAFLGERRHYRASRPERHFARLRESHAGSHAAARTRRIAAAKRRALPAAGGRCPRLCDLHAGRERFRGYLECGRRAYQRLQGEPTSSASISPGSIRPM